MSARSRLIAFASQRLPRLSSRILDSAGYTLDLDRYGPEAGAEWSPATAERQDRAWLPIVAAAKAGDAREDVRALMDALGTLAISGRVLEVGCGGGYNSEIIALAAPQLEYTGLDLSAPMIERCRQKYPDRAFVVGSAFELPFPDDSFDLVVDGVALLHMPEWPRALGEYARVSKGPVMLHGLTLTERPTTPFLKYAYGQPAYEIVFNRSELETEIAELGFAIADRLPNLEYDLADVLGIPSVSETWVLTR